MRKRLIIGAGIVFLIAIGIYAARSLWGQRENMPSNAANTQKITDTLRENASSSAASSTNDSSKLEATAHYIVIGTAKIRIGIADTEAEREQGLSGRPSLASDEGLFFVTDSPSILGIWMKDMLFPIDVIWFDSNLKIVTIIPNMLPESYPTIYNPLSSAQFVLEVSSGTAARAGMYVGEKAVLEAAAPK